jgi:3-oxoadipate enol-lactonase
MALVTINEGQAIGYDEAGEGVKTPVVFLHGVGSDRSVWLRQLVHFGHERRAIAIDYPGYGDSDPVSEDTSRDDYATAILAAMSQLGIYRAHICGLSLGGVVAIAMHDLAPERCASLVLADTFAIHPEGKAIYERSLAGSTDMRVLADSRVDVLLAQPAEPGVRAEVVKTMSAIDPEAYRIGARAVWLADQRERAAAIRVPTLVICGSQDRVTPPALSHVLAQSIPGAQQALIEGAGHLGNLEKPAEFDTLVGAFIRGVDSRSS